MRLESRLKEGFRENIVMGVNIPKLICRSADITVFKWCANVLRKLKDIM